MPPMINPQNRVLLKFMSRKEYVNDFLSGHLYMNCLDYFWNEYKPETADGKTESLTPGQRDLFEGVYCTCDVDTFGFEKSLKGALITDISMRAEGYKYCNVHSYYRLDYWPDRGRIGWKSSSRMRDFGDYVVIIADEKEFLKRVHAAASREGFEYLCGNVHYRQPKRKGEAVELGNRHHGVVRADGWLIDVTEEPYKNMINGKRDSFDKMSPMSYQKEWRISLYRGVKACEAYTLDLGCRLDDIVYTAEAENLNQELEKLFLSKKISLGGRYIWYGNIDKHALRDKFYGLGDNKASLLGVIG